MSDYRGVWQADGLSYCQYQTILNALEPKLHSRISSADEPVYQWLAIKLSEKVEIMRQAATLAAHWRLEASATITPRKTTYADVAGF